MPPKIIDKSDRIIAQIPAWVGAKNGYQNTFNELEYYKETNKKLYQTVQWKTEHKFGTIPFEFYTQGLD